VKTRIPFTLGAPVTPLAHAQTSAVAARLQVAHPRLAPSLVQIVAPSDLAERRPFLAEPLPLVEEMDSRLLAGDFRLVVHRASDLTQTLPDGLVNAAVLERETPYDAFLNRAGRITDEMEKGSLIGVLNLRAKAQMQALWPELEIRILTGGVEGAVEKMLRHGLVDGLVLPAAVTEHLGIQAIVTELYYPEVMLPSSGQGMLVVLARADDREARDFARAIHSPATRLEMLAEMAFLEHLTSDQDVPAGVLAQVEGKKIYVTGAIASPTGKSVNRLTKDGPAMQAAEIGASVAEQLKLKPNALIDLIEADFPDGLPAAQLDQEVAAELSASTAADLEAEFESEGDEEFADDPELEFDEDEGDDEDAGTRRKPRR
jgi:hydroxymethylbilane synthase